MRPQMAAIQVVLYLVLHCTAYERIAGKKANLSLYMTLISISTRVYTWLLFEFDIKEDNYNGVLFSWKSCCCSVAKLCSTPRDPKNCSTPGFSVLHCLLEFAQIHVHWVGDAIQPSHPLSSPCPLALNLSHHQGLFQWVSSSLQVAKVSELQLQHLSFQWIFRVDVI